VKAAIVLAALVAVPAAARADIGIRAGLEALIASHDGNAGKTAVFLGDQSVVTGDLMLQYWLPANIVSLDAEIAEAYDFKAGNRVGTTFRPGITISPPVLPIYLRGAIPIDFEGPNNRPTIAGLRLGVGTNIGLPVAKLYIEADADFPLFGGTGAPSAFSQQNLSLGAGVAFRF
jgi:hypothetical protein